MDPKFFQSGTDRDQPLQRRQRAYSGLAEEKAPPRRLAFFMIGIIIPRSSSVLFTGRTGETGRIRARDLTTAGRV
jgi:hypothetical protein